MFMLTKMGIEPIKHPASAIFLSVCVCVRGSVAEQLGCWTSNQQKKKEADLYSAFIEVPYTQGAQVWMTQCYLQITPYLPLPRKHSPDGASQTEVVDI